MFNHKQQKSEGNAKRKSNRYSILMLALIFIGFATYGTYAYFTDSTSIRTDIELTAGTVSFDTKNVGDWQYVTWDNSSTSRNLSLVNKSANNLQPGDAFQKTVTIHYSGSLRAKISIKDIDTLIQDVQKVKYDAAVVVKLNGSLINPDQYAGFDVQQNEEIEITIKIGLSPKNEPEKFNEDGSRNKSNGLSLNQLNPITVTAVQTN
ncbi:hypothetical protein A5886_001034 [Enterococcus sp. 8G7_MSG3316]|uniref:Uncharacterized protein n=1 Tax=Candidatus Enterococcus testudinis TaxID=1834191 RepID=A0A242A4J1_9ENTE|nr:hypothetical protein [Enterococcus sp. 8G7_MSG3316]OTN75958.1 hypothetical protein A5886_001034 [Enterococcus sp. 8G7_MSG3316]